MHVGQFLLDFIFAEDIERVEAALPEAIARMIMDGGRQSRARERLAAPGTLKVLAQRSNERLADSSFNPFRVRGVVAAAWGLISR